MTTDQVLDVLGVSGSHGKTLCPSHDDDKASLSVTRTDEDKILVKCHAGCDQIDVLRGLEAEFGITSRDLGNGGAQTRRVAARYVYKDENGKPIFAKVRFEPKEFVIEPAGAGAQPMLYNLPEIRRAPAIKTVVWVEGEKAADRLMAEGILATTMGGASKAPDKAVKVLKDRRVVILPDNDEPGRKHADTVAKCLKAVGCRSVRILSLPGLSVKGDVVDWLEDGNSVEHLRSLIRRAVGNALAASRTVRNADWLWQPRIPAQGLTILFGDGGLGKSTLMIDLIARWTRGDPMPETVGGPFDPITVAAYGFEDDIDSVVLPRLMAAGANLERVSLLEPDPEKPVLPDQINYLRQLCEEVDAQVLVIDNIENGMGNSTETNSSRSLRSALNPLADFGIPVIAIHHPKKGAVNLDPREAMTGSQAYTNISRSILTVIPGDEGEVAFAAVKSNMAPVHQTRTLYYKIATREVDGVGETPYIEWLGGDNTSANVLQAAARARFMETQRNALGQTLGAAGGRPSFVGIEDRVTDILEEDGEWLTPEEIASAHLGVSRRTFQRRLAELVEEGKIEKRGFGRATEYRKAANTDTRVTSSLSYINTENKGFGAILSRIPGTPDGSEGYDPENTPESGHRGAIRGAIGAIGAIGDRATDAVQNPICTFPPPKKVDPWVAKVRAKLIAQGAIPGDGPEKA